MTIVTVLAAAGLLTVLALGLLLILKPLQSVRGSLEQIAFGVRAIQHQIAGLEPRAERLAGTLPALASATGSAAAGLRRAAGGTSGGPESGDD